MNLINTTELPPQGYLYKEVAIGWEMPRDVALQGMRQAASALQQARINNPQAGLDPSYEACVAAISAYTCARLSSTRHLTYWCGGEPVTEQERQQVEAARRKAARPVGGCASCGGRR